jgi:ABC-type phosphate/phosphonate transport system substrate-binding protein
MNLPRRALAEIAGGEPFFRRVVETGGHPASLERLLSGDGDVASIDCVTFAFWRHYRPDAAARVRVLAETPPSPAIPFVTSIATPISIVELLRMHSAASQPSRAMPRRAPV